MPLGKSSKVLFLSVENDQRQYMISRILGGGREGGKVLFPTIVFNN